MSKELPVIDLSLFRHKITLHVRFNEVDMLGVCNNAVYLSFFEEGKIQYLKEAKMFPLEGLFTDGSEYFIVRNEVNYRGFAHYDDELDIYTRITAIGRSSYGFAHVVVQAASSEIIADGRGVMVHVDPLTRKPAPIAESFKAAVRAFEKTPPETA